MKRVPRLALHLSLASCTRLQSDALGSDALVGRECLKEDGPVEGAGECAGIVLEYLKMTGGCNQESRRGQSLTSILAGGRKKGPKVHDRTENGTSTHRFEPFDERRAGLALPDVVERKVEQVLVFELAEEPLQPSPGRRSESARDHLLSGRGREHKPRELALRINMTSRCLHAPRSRCKGQKWGRARRRRTSVSAVQGMSAPKMPASSASAGSFARTPSRIRLRFCSRSTPESPSSGSSLTSTRRRRDASSSSSSSSPNAPLALVVVADPPRPDPPAVAVALIAPPPACE